MTAHPNLKQAVRKYFYFISSHSHLFLESTKHKNFTSCFKNKQFLKFFYWNLKPNGIFEDVVETQDCSTHLTKAQESQSAIRDENQAFSNIKFQVRTENDASNDVKLSDKRLAEYPWVSECRANADNALELNFVKCELGTPFIFQNVLYRPKTESGLEDIYLFSSSSHDTLPSIDSKDLKESNNFYLTFANAQFQVPFRPSQLYMDKEGRLCQYFNERPWNRYGPMKGILSDELCNKLQWRIFSDEEQIRQEGGSIFLQWFDNVYNIPFKEDSWDGEVLQMRKNMMVKNKEDFSQDRRCLREQRRLQRKKAKSI